MTSKECKKCVESKKKLDYVSVVEFKLEKKVDLRLRLCVEKKKEEDNWESQEGEKCPRWAESILSVLYGPIQGIPPQMTHHDQLSQPWRLPLFKNKAEAYRIYLNLLINGKISR
jgi:hypothetical protein